MDLRRVLHHDVDADPFEIPKPCLDVVSHGLRRLPRYAKQKANLIRHLCSILRCDTFHTLVDHLSSESVVKRLHAHFYFYRDPFFCKVLPPLFHMLPVHPVDLKAQLSDVFFQTHPLDPCHSFLRKLQKTARIDDFQAVILPCHMAERLFIDAVICRLIPRRIQMIVTKTTP